MSLVRFESVTKRFGGVPLLDSIDFRVEEGEKVGLIGRNGSGKSTIFRLIAGDIQPDSGVVERMRKAKVACLEQLPRLPPSDSIFDVVMRSFQDLIALETQLSELELRIAQGAEDQMDRYSALQDQFHVRGGYEFRSRANRVLHGLGFTREEFGLPVSALSGGQRTRLLLALVLLEDADLLLLDEPENHLDLRAREWLEGFVRDTGKAVVIVSHDRHILNTVVTRIVEVERATLTTFTGNYRAYVDAKAVRNEQQLKAHLRQQRLIEKETRWINRFRYKNTKARQVQSRIKRLEKLDRVEAPPSEQRAARVAIGEPTRSGDLALEARDLGMSFDTLTLYSGVSLRIERGDRIGIIGPNGSGKTTLLRHLAGTLSPGQGRPLGSVRHGHKVRLGFYEQHHESVNTANDVFTEIRTVRPDMTPEQVRTFLGRLLFTEDDAFQPVSTLSGGELSRVAIAKLILSDANLLLLDEPTNHLDVATSEAVEQALAGFHGTLLLASHDRTLIDRLVTKLIIVEGGNAVSFLGSYSEYQRDLSQDSAQDAGEGPRQDALRIRAGSAPSPRGKGRRQDNTTRKLRKQLEELERDIASLETLIGEREVEFAGLDPSDYERATTLKEEYEGLKQDLQNMYAEWENIAGALEST